MTKLGIGVAVLATVSCLSVGAQTINVTTLDQAGAQMVLQAAKASAQQRHAPSAIAVVDPAGDLLAFERMDSVRPASADLAIGKARERAAHNCGLHRDNRLRSGLLQYIVAIYPLYLLYYTLESNNHRYGLHGDHWHFVYDGIYACERRSIYCLFGRSRDLAAP